MGSSLSLLLISVVCGIAGLLRLFRHKQLNLRGVLDAVAFGLVLPVIAAAVVAGVGVTDAISAVHALYLLLTVTVPLISAGVLISWKRSASETRSSGAVLIVPIITSLFALVGLYATHIEPRWLRIDEVAMEADIDIPIRIGVLADIQSPAVGAWEEKVFDELIAGDPDVVLIAGDMWQVPTGDISPADREPFDRLIRRLVQAVGPVFLVEGDHDRYRDLRDMAEATGAQLLLDEIAVIDIRGQSVAIAGLGLGAGGPWRVEAIAEIDTYNDEAFTILLSHRPETIHDLEREQRVDLIVSGHTHGGQVVLPLIGPLLYYPEVPRNVILGGLHELNDRPIYVSTGAGVRAGTAPQVRFGSRPSIGFIDVVPDPALTSAAP
ncbi:MAG: putative MPP superfamily phosphohydrolase [Candidatus Poriferisodalaceae bacterium]|jgi:predicted MPP superfamily phosphohydrolase